MVLGECRKIVEYVGANEVHAVGKPVLCRIFLCHFQRIGRNIDGCDVFCASLCGIERKGPGVREAVQHAPVFCQRADCRAVIFLVQEEPGLLSLDIVHGIADAVFGDGYQPGGVGQQPVPVPEALGKFHALQLPNRRLVALIEHMNLLSERLAQQGKQTRINLILNCFHSE